jgi:hypothetical protein
LLKETLNSQETEEQTNKEPTFLSEVQQPIVPPANSIASLISKFSMLTNKEDHFKLCNNLVYHLWRLKGENE